VSVIFPIAAALAVREPAIPASPQPPLTLNGVSLANAAGAFQSAERATRRQCCTPGSPAELAAAGWVASQMRRFDPHPELDQFASQLPWRPNPVAMTNVIAYAPGTQPGVIAVIAHRDGFGADNAAGTAMLAKVLAPLPLQRGIVLVSTDGGTSGGQGVERFARSWPLADHIVAAVVLDSVAAPEGVRMTLLLRSQSPRGTSPTLVAAAREELTQATGQPPKLPGALDQLSGYAVPYASGEQGPLLAHGIPAITIAGGPLAGRPETLSGLNVTELSGVGGAVANMVAALDSTPSIEPAGPPMLFLGGEVVRGWLVQIALTALLAPVLACVLDLVAGLRRRRLPLAAGARAFAWRASTWLVGLLVLWLLTLAPGRLLSPISGPPLAGRTAVSTDGLLLAAGLTLLYWRFVARPRLAPAGPVSGAERTAGLATGLAGMMFSALLLAAANPFALILVLPAAHAWLWLGAAARGGRRMMALVWLIGLAGPALAVFELWSTQGLGEQTPRALVAMVASGYISPAVSVCLALFAAAGCQLGSLVLGRYSPAHVWLVPAGGSRAR
jgi:hypothetical protein